MRKKCRICQIVMPLNKFRMTNKGPAARCLYCQANSRRFQKRRFLEAYSNGKCQCVCCGEAQLEFLALDHIGGQKTRIKLGYDGLGSGIRSRFGRKLKRQGYPHTDKLRVLCANCNAATSWSRICPHQQKDGDDMRRPYNQALSIANEFIEKFIKNEYRIAGSLRRKEATIGDVDLIVLEPLSVIEKRLTFTKFGKRISGGNKKLDVDYKGMRFNIYFAKQSYLGSMLFFLTGPAGYSIAYRRRAKERGWGLNQYGLFEDGGLGKKIAGKTEEGIYKAFDKNYKSPELRGK